jgi:dihydrofolate synthase/folylpolyglutamate synthase
MKKEDIVNSYLKSLQPGKIRFGLERIQKALMLRKEPHLLFKTIHIGGTNGKGSVAAMLSSILTKANIKVGMFTSPHLDQIRERIQIKGQKIPEAEFNDLVLELQSCLKDIDLSFFEFLTLLAYEYFAQKKIEIGVFEVGMGGRLDATNVIRPLCTIITNIEKDHTDILGKTLIEISKEKIAIIKRSIPVISAVSQVEIQRFIQHTCDKLDSPLFLLGRDINIERQDGRFSYQGLGKIIKDLKLGLFGSFQLKNAALAIAGIQIIRQSFSVSDQQIKDGLKDVRWPGRMEIICKEPTIILDGAHNPFGLKTVITALSELSYKRLIVIFGAMKDKDISNMLKELKTADILIFVRLKDKRAFSPEQYAGSNNEIIEDIKEAIIRAKELADLDDLILITGSLYTVAEARKVLIQ